jgi:predicted transcriptional regulator
MSAKAVSCSASLPEHIDEQLRSIAHRENRTIGNVVESAVRVFTALPREFRDLLVEMAMDETSGRERIRETARQALYAEAQTRLSDALERVAAAMNDGKMLDDFDDAAVVSSRFDVHAPS